MKTEGKEPQFLLLNKAGQGWVMPKGHVEDGETPEVAAKREVSEEAGISLNDLRVLTELGRVEYSFVKDGVENQKIVHIFLVEDNSPSPPHPLRAEDFLEVGYFEKSEALKIIAHENMKEFISEAWDYLRHDNCGASRTRNISHRVIWNGKEVLFEWLAGGPELVGQYGPITQGYGLCVNENREVVIVSGDEGKTWTLPGGSVEPGETVWQTLEREVAEEADIEISGIKFLGLQKVTDEGRVYYQARFFCRVERVLPQTIDPAKGKVLMRRFVPIATLNQVLKWGNVADELVRLSINLAAGTLR